MTIKTIKIRGEVEQIMNYGRDEEAEYEPTTLEEWTEVDHDTCTGLALESIGDRMFHLGLSEDFETKE